MRFAVPGRYTPGTALGEQGTKVLRCKRFVEHGRARVRQKRLESGGEGIPGQKNDALTKLGLVARQRLVKALPV
jgi:hypothetical protein